jgi:lipopolysaccharide transport protein LptA
MHRPENTINQWRPRQNPVLIFVLAGTLLSAGLAMAAGERLKGFSVGDTITIQAENAWEDVAPDTIKFSGNFELKARDWYLSADQATLYGNLDDPETAILTGSPANIQLETVSDDRIETITGKATRIVYQRATNSISLVGRASLSRAGQAMQSEEIEYDIDRDLIQAGGSQGVHIRVKPED